LNEERERDGEHFAATCFLNVTLGSCSFWPFKQASVINYIKAST